MRTTLLTRSVLAVAAAALLPVAALSGPASSTAAGVPAAQQDERAPKKVLQLGDSYSSGDGAGDYWAAGCLRSPGTYGRRFADAVGAQRYQNRACAGGVTADLTNRRELGERTVRASYLINPQNHPDQRAEFRRRAIARQACGARPAPDLTYRYGFSRFTIAGSTVSADIRCSLGARPQVAAVTRDTDVVLLTMGGNDIGFSGIVANCMVFRDPRNCRSSIELADALLPSVPERLRQAMTTIHRKAPRADVYLVSYPFLMDRTSYGIPEAAPTYDAGRALMRLQARGDNTAKAGIAELNDQLDTDAFHYVSTIKKAWQGRGLDPRAGATNDDSWLHPVGAPGRIPAEFVHPRPAGYAATARASVAFWRAHH